ncbi:MAG: hypothetical protein PUP91_25120 [Rhizonema sp. PD37]|nr:hypothetical protein [Rhizonema sp. PD37]
MDIAILSCISYTLSLAQYWERGVHSCHSNDKYYSRFVSVPCVLVRSGAEVFGSDINRTVAKIAKALVEVNGYFS